MAENLPGIRQWVSNPPPIELDVDGVWPALEPDAVFSANTCHIMSWPQVEKMISGIGRVLAPGGVFALYGPFKYALAAAAGLRLQEDHAMPANNRLLVWNRL